MKKVFRQKDVQLQALLRDIRYVREWEPGDLAADPAAHDAGDADAQRRHADEVRLGDACDVDCSHTTAASTSTIARR